MKNAKIVLVAQWDGWCGACAAERPLVLTRTGRQRLRTWLAGAAADSRPLVLSCRLCGTGVDVPLEQDDPPVTVAAQEDAQPALEAVTVVAEVAASPPPGGPVQASAVELSAGRQDVAQALGRLLASRVAATALPAPLPGATPALVPAVPMQRSASSGGLAELQLLADGIDLLSTGRG